MDNAWLPNLFLDQESSDVQLRLETSAGDQEAVVPAHSLVLRHASKVFRTMLDNTNFKEGRTGVVELKVKGDIAEAIFFLRFLYTRELEHLDLNVYISVLQTAHLYEVDDLVKLCNERIAEDVTPLTVCQTYGQLKNVASEELLNRCKDMMLEFSFLVFKKNLHLILDEETMSFLLSSDKLNVLDEEQVLGALWRWGCARRVLGDEHEKNIDFKTVNLSCLIRTHLVKHVPNDYPWCRLLENAKTAKEMKKSGSSLEINCRNRQPDVSNKPHRFAEFDCFSNVASSTEKITLDVANQCLAMFSADREILLSGVAIQITIDAELSSQNLFQFFVNHEEVTHLISVEKELLSEYNNQQVVRGPWKSQQSAERPRETAAPQITLANPTDIFTAMLFQRVVTTPSQPTPQADQCSAQSGNHFYTYDLTLSFRTPIVLKKADRNIFSLRMKDVQKSRILLTAYNFPQNSTLTFSRKLKFTVLGDRVSVRRIYYFV